MSQTFDTIVGQNYRVTFYVGRTGPGSRVSGLLAQVTSGSGSTVC